MSRPLPLNAAWAAYHHPHATRAELRAYQDAQLRRLVQHAYQHVPYYRTLFDAHGLHPRHIRGTQDLSLIPISTKQEMQKYGQGDLVATGVRQDKLISVRTSGSTGEPLTVRRTYLEQCFFVFWRHRAFRSFGMGLRDRIVGVGRGRKASPQEKKLAGRLFHALGGNPKLQIDGLDGPEEVVRQLTEYHPRIIVALPGILTLTADYLITTGRDHIRPAILVVGGEVLTPVMRQRLRQAFGVEPVQTYGSHEFPLLAWECVRSHELHTCDDAVILEVLQHGRPAGEREDGEAVVTNLHAYTMPFIRYQLADVVTRGLEQCSCGQPFSTIRTIQGRTIDYLLLPDGRRLHPYRVIQRLLDGMDGWIRQYQFLQARPDHIVLEVVPLRPVTSEMRERASQLVAPLFGEDVRLDLQVVERIESGPGGKYRHCRSFLQSQYEDLVSAGANV